MADHLLVLHGPNLNLLGTREPEVYGRESLASIDASLVDLARSHDARLVSFQSNHEGALIDRIHAARAEGIDAIVINPGGLTHTSVALRDALLAVGVPFIEVHLSNVHAREAFRHASLLSDAAVGVVCGLGSFGYRVAVEFALQRLPE